MDNAVAPQSADLHQQPLEAIEPTEVHRQAQRLSFVNNEEKYEEKYANGDIEVASVAYSDELDPLKVIVPDENDEFIDPRLKNYPIPQVAKTVDLHNDDT